MPPKKEAFFLQRGWDSNPRYVAINTLSKRAPSATRPPLYFLFWSANNLKKNELRKQNLIIILFPLVRKFQR